jgi:hypothetical protein
MANALEFRKRPPARPSFPELSVVSLRHPVKHGDTSIPAGTTGTVVAAYRDGAAYEVKVFAPFHAVVTVGRDDLTA